MHLTEINDFHFVIYRSPGSGLYDNLQQYNLPYAEAIFEINYFHHNPKPFFALAKELYPGNYQPNLSHYLIRLLHDKGLLLRMYTQNIDGLERSTSCTYLYISLNVRIIKKVFCEKPVFVCVDQSCRYSGQDACWSTWDFCNCHLHCMQKRI